MLLGFNWLDGAILIFVLIFVVTATKAGLVKSTFTIVGLVLGLVLAAKFYVYPSNLIAGWIDLPRLAADTAGFLAIFLFTATVIHALGYAASAVTRFQPLKLLDRIGGLAIGLLLGLGVSGLVLIMLAALPIYATFPDHVDESRIALPIMEITRETFEQFDQYLPFNLPRERRTEDPIHFSLCRGTEELTHRKVCQFLRPPGTLLQVSGSRLSSLKSKPAFLPLKIYHHGNRLLNNKLLFIIKTY